MLFTNPAFNTHESVHFVSDAGSGLRAIIAVHSTALGPAIGGCRMWQYASEDDALRDALRLSRGMSLKNAMADLPFGGGKSVILGNPAQCKSPALLAAFGRAIEKLGGVYITAEDVGISVSDMVMVAANTRFVCGLPQHRGSVAAGGDPSPRTAHGVFCGIAAAVRHQLKRDDLVGLRVAVQGLGKVGFDLCRELYAAGARLVVADLDAQIVERARDEFAADSVAIGQILYEPVDVLAPCALGAVLNSTTIPRLNTHIVAGAANNQLDTVADGWLLQKHGILYAPDYVINAGGIINAAAEYLASIADDEVRRRVERIGDTLSYIFDRAQHSDRPTSVIADEIALSRLQAASEQTHTAHAA